MEWIRLSVDSDKFHANALTNRRTVGYAITTLMNGVKSTKFCTVAYQKQVTIHNTLESAKLKEATRQA